MFHTFDVGLRLQTFLSNDSSIYGLPFNVKYRKNKYRLYTCEYQVINNKCN